MKARRIGAAAAMVTGLVACAPEGPGPLIPGDSGRIAAPVGGSLIGGFVGHGIGRWLDADDVDLARRAERQARAAPTGQPIAWSNPANGHAGTVTPLREGRDAARRDCREYRATLTVGAETATLTGAACRQADGEWVVVVD